MKRTVWTIVYLLCLCSGISAQDKLECPTLAITPQAGIVVPGDVMQFVLNVSDPTPSKFTFDWTVSAGTIVEGQGAMILKVRTPTDPTDVTATVQVGGLPQSCTTTVSETARAPIADPGVVDDYGPLPLADEKSRLRQLFDRHTQKYDGLLMIVIHAPKTGSITFKSREQTITTLLRELGVGAEKYKIIDGGGGEAETLIYLVPSGATPPAKCENCELRNDEKSTRDCPTLEVTGPAGFSEPGSIMPFVLTVSDPTSRKLTFVWTVSAGTIVQGQGTSVLKVRVPDNHRTPTLTATVTVGGLPKNCVSTASETGGIDTREGDPYDIYGNLSINDEYARLQSGVTAIRAGCSSCQLVIIKRYPHIGPAETNRIRRLHTFITSWLNFPASRFTIIPKVFSRTETVIWFVPPGAKIPNYPSR
jgi:hypothetical protein